MKVHPQSFWFGARGEGHRGMQGRREQFKEGEQIAGTPYRVHSLIGSGGMGSVYEVEHLELGRVFVLKALHTHLASRSDLVGRMRNEWRALAKLNHPHIVQVTDAGQTPSGLPYFVMERLEGRTLGQLLSEFGRLSSRRASEIIVDVLLGLDAAHATGAIHRDIKPQNIFVQDSGTTKLLDFGIAKLRDGVARVVTAGGVSIGTPRYMAPEQAEGTVVDGRADIYAAALVLYECVLGRGPFAHIKDPNELVMAHIGEEPERADFLDASVTPELGDLLHRWLAKSPQSRPANAGLAVRELRALLATFPEASPTSDITLGGDYDASTVGANPSPSLIPALEQDAPQVRLPLEDAVVTPAVAPRAASPLTPTATFAPTSKKAIKDTLGWGTKVEDSSVDSPLAKRPSKTPPPISAASASHLFAKAKDRWPTRRSGAVVVGTAVVSFVLAWGAVALLRAGAESKQASGSGADASALEQSQVHSARVESAARADKAATALEQEPSASPPDSQNDPVTRAQAEDVSQVVEPVEPTPVHSSPTTDVSDPSSNKAALESPQVAPRPAPAKPRKKSVTKVPVQAGNVPQRASSDDAPVLPGSGLW